uniref:Uncharacterized protein n=1 Tax=Siphoviridae sp. ctnPP24 TaxID=2825662 RepID=A0A8S5TYX0_9CAUD|nr:MAG TPA: hypothetical protein [Siphoviridae sp. ctnPP24]
MFIKCVIKIQLLHINFGMLILYTESNFSAFIYYNA